MKDIFPTLIGNEQLRRALFGNLSHAYIIEGAPGSGKLTAARLAASAVLCENKDSAEGSIPCGECSVCSRISRGIHPDVIEFSPGTKKSIGVDTARLIRSQVFISPSESSCKFFVIRDADLMTPEAQNALLISLEEPPEFSVFFLLVSDRSLLLETIRSRCHILSTEKLNDEKIASALENLPEGNRLKSTDISAFDSIIKSANGSLGEAIRLLTDKSDDSDSTATDAAELVRVILSGTQVEKVELTSTLTKTKDHLDKTFTTSLYLIRDIIANKMHTDADPMFFRELSEVPHTSVSLKKLMTVAASLEEGRNALSGNVSPALTAERIIMQKL